MLKLWTLGQQRAGTPVFLSPGKDSAVPGELLSDCLEASDKGGTKHL